MRACHRFPDTSAFLLDDTVGIGYCDYLGTQVLRYNTGSAIRAFFSRLDQKNCILGFLMTNHGLSKLALAIIDDKRRFVKIRYASHR